jgi:hypothetical protein
VCAQVLFQNDSLATLLARVVGILGPIDPELLRKGRDTHKFFTKNHRLYERNQVGAARKVSWCEFEYMFECRSILVYITYWSFRAGSSVESGSVRLCCTVVETV